MPFPTSNNLLNLNYWFNGYPVLTNVNSSRTNLLNPYKFWFNGYGVLGVQSYILAQIMVLGD
jgi:hypothetical protein